MTVHNLDLAQGLSLRFRHLAGELREARRSEKHLREISEITSELYLDLIFALGEKLLPPVIHEAVLKPNSGGWDAIIGYEFKTCKASLKKSNPSLIPDLGLDYQLWCESMSKELNVPANIIQEAFDSTPWDGVKKHFSIIRNGRTEWFHLTDVTRDPKDIVEINPGFISMVWPDVFKPIFHELSGSVSDTEDAINRAIEAERFRITGYVALAYEKLAEWIENHADDDHDDHDNPIPPGDGLKCNDTVFVWGGKTYTSITPNISDALKVLMKAFRESRDATKPEFENVLSEVTMKNGFGSLFMVGKSPNKKPHPVRSIILPLPNQGGRGKYRLIDPVKAK